MLWVSHNWPRTKFCSTLATSCFHNSTYGTFAQISNSQNAHKAFAVAYDTASSTIASGADDQPQAFSSVMFERHQQNIKKIFIQMKYICSYIVYILGS